MNLAPYTLPLAVLFIVAAVFGVFFMPMHEAAGCPLMLGDIAICPAPLIEHIGDWQAAFIATLSGLLSLFAAALLIAVFTFDLFLASTRQHFRVHMQRSTRPTLLQELFSQGILNRRAP